MRKHFGDDPAVVDRVVTIDDVSRRIIGVLPSRFNFPDSSYVSGVPSTWSARMCATRLRGALRRGVTEAQIDERLAVLSTALFEAGALPKDNRRKSTPMQVQ